MIIRFSYRLPVLFLSLLCACRKPAAPAAAAVTDTTQTYFSVRQFVRDQIQTYYGQPFSLHRIAAADGRTDSTIVNFYNLDWAPVYKAFLSSDISDPKYLGHYRFSTFEDDATANRVLMYEATDKELFTRQLQLIIDPTNMRILSMYIETAKSGQHQRLLYIPLKVIQIQEEQRRWLGKTRRLKLEYRFLQ